MHLHGGAHRAAEIEAKVRRKKKERGRQRWPGFAMLLPIIILIPLQFNVTDVLAQPLPTYDTLLLDHFPFSWTSPAVSSCQLNFKSFPRELPDASS